MALGTTFFGYGKKRVKSTEFPAKSDASGDWEGFGQPAASGIRRAQADSGEGLTKSQDTPHPAPGRRENGA